MIVDVLAISPHPDDVELFCGGTLAELARLGHRVAIADLTRGERASNGSVESRAAAGECAAQVLGVRTRTQLGLPDAGLRAGDPEQLRPLAALLRALRPQLLLAPYASDRHPDHVAASHLSAAACFQAALAQADLEGAPHRVERLVYYPCHAEPERLDVFVDISASIAKWRQALACYADQFARTPGAVPTPINEPDFLARHEARRVEWGRRSSCHFAEAFVLQDSIARSAGTLLPDGNES